MKTIINSKNAPAPIGPYSQAVMAGNTLFASGQIAINPATGELEMSSIEIETEQVMQNIKAILLETNFTFENVIKATIFVADMNDYSKVNSIYGAYFNDKTAPARELVEVSALPKNAKVEISVIAKQIN